MFDFFGKQRRQELYDRAYAEFVSGNLRLSLNFLNELISEGTKDYRIFNLRAQVFLALDQNHLAFRDALSSIKCEVSFERNLIGYEIRNSITQHLKTGRLKCDFFSLREYFNLENTITLFIESIQSFLESVESKPFQAALKETYKPMDIPGKRGGTIDVNLLTATYMNLGLRFLEYKVHTSKDLSNSDKSQYYTEIRKRVNQYYNMELDFFVFNDFFRQGAHFYSLTDTPQPEYMYRVFNDYFFRRDFLNQLFQRESPNQRKFLFARHQLYSDLNFNYEKITSDFLHFLEFDVMLQPLVTSHD